MVQGPALVPWIKTIGVSIKDSPLSKREALVYRRAMGSGMAWGPFLLVRLGATPWCRQERNQFVFQICLVGAKPRQANDFHLFAHLFFFARYHRATIQHATSKQRSLSPSLCHRIASSRTITHLHRCLSAVVWLGNWNDHYSPMNWSVRSSLDRTSHRQK